MILIKLFFNALLFFESIDFTFLNDGDAKLVIFDFFFKLFNQFFCFCSWFLRLVKDSATSSLCLKASSSGNAMGRENSTRILILLLLFLFLLLLGSNFIFSCLGVELAHFYNIDRDFVMRLLIFLLFDRGLLIKNWHLLCSRGFCGGLLRKEYNLVITFVLSDL